MAEMFKAKSKLWPWASLVLLCVCLMWLTYRELSWWPKTDGAHKGKENSKNSSRVLRKTRRDLSRFSGKGRLVPDLFINRRVSAKSRVRAKTDRQKDAYAILGVVKKKQLYLVVQFRHDRRIGWVAAGEQINSRDRVVHLTADRVEIEGLKGKSSAFAIFRFQEITGQVPAGNSENKGEK